MAEIKGALLRFNPWWENEFKADYKRREIYAKIQKYLKMPQILAFTGLRRVGKTTIMHKIAEDYIKNNFDKKKILYFSFDEYKEEQVVSVIKEYEDISGFNLRKEKFLFLLDEIQKVKDWENQIKTLYDIYKPNIKFILSGSETLFIRRKSKETLAGRIFEFKVEQLTFKEFLNFKNQEFRPIGIYMKTLQKLFNEYIHTQGFPELTDVQDYELINKYIKEGIIEKVVFRDIQESENIKDIAVVHSLLNILTNGPGQIVEITDISNQLGVSRQTISNYLRYLEDAFLIKKLYNFSKSRRKVERKLKKYYPSIISPDLAFMNDTLSKSKIFEWFVVTQINAEFFWKDPYKNEVDIIIYDKTIVPVEIKYGKIETKGLERFMEKFQIEKGYIISFEDEKVIKKNSIVIKVIPAFKYFLGDEKDF